MNPLLRIRFTEITKDLFEAHVAASPNRASATVKIRRPQIDAASLDKQLRGWRTRLDARESVEPGSPRALGITLFDALFQGQMRDVFNDVRNLRFLQLQLDFADAPKLGVMPWEYLCDPKGDFLYSEGIRITRFLGSVTPVDAEALLPPMKLLIVIAVPEDQVAFDGAEDARELEKELLTLREAGVVIVDRTERGTLAALKQKLPDGYDAVHFVGHGETDDDGNGLLYFEDETGQSDPIEAAALGRLLKEYPRIRLVVLNTCHGAAGSVDSPFSGTAQTLVRDRIPAVVGMQRSITNAAALEFARGFYRAISRYESIDAAVALGALDIRTNEVEWGTPALYLQTQTIFLPPPPPITRFLMERTARGRLLIEAIALAKPGNEFATRLWGSATALTAGLAIALVAADVYRYWFNLGIVPWWKRAFSRGESLVGCILVGLSTALIYALFNHRKSIRAIALTKLGYVDTTRLAIYTASLITLGTVFALIPPTVQMRTCRGELPLETPAKWQAAIEREADLAAPKYQEARWFIGSLNSIDDISLQVNLEPSTLVQFDRLRRIENISTSDVETCWRSTVACLILKLQRLKDDRQAGIRFSIGSAAQNFGKVKVENVTARVRILNGQQQTLGEASVSAPPELISLYDLSVQPGTVAGCGDWQ